MIDVPAFCGGCGSTFRSGVVVDNAASVISDEKFAGPCPACNGMGQVSDAILGFVANTIHILSAPQLTTDDLSQLASILNQAHQTKQSPAEVIKTIKEGAPELSEFANILPESQTKLYAFVPFIASVIVLLLPASQGDSDRSNATVEQAINQVFSEQKRAQDEWIIRRNAPCVCGSGERYKRCCGKVSDMSETNQPTT